MRAAPFALVIAAALSAGAASAAPPMGYLDAAGCDGFYGWAMDPDETGKAIDVHLYLGGPAGTPGVPAIVANASVHREDLCTAIGSCDHGFVAFAPLSLLDGQPREIHAYGIDSMGGNNPELGSSPRILQCAPAASGVRRRVAGLASYDAWGFSSFHDLLPLPAADADALADGPDFPASPDLVEAEGTSDVWLVDGGVRRAVSSAAALAWRFDLTTVETRPAAEIDDLVEGSPLRARPILVARGALYVVDDAEPAIEGAIGVGASGGGGGDVAPDDAPPGPSASSGCDLSGAGAGDGLAPLALLALLMMGRSRVTSTGCTSRGRRRG